MLLEHRRLNHKRSSREVRGRNYGSRVRRADGRVNQDQARVLTTDLVEAMYSAFPTKRKTVS
jgi:hypothetical protein